MGVQVNFWMTANDEQEFIQRLAQDDVVWTPRKLALGGRPVLCELDTLVPSEHKQWLMLIRREDWKNLLYADIALDPMPQMTHRVFQPWTMVGGDGSPAFHWNTCARPDGLIRRGRIYYETNWFDGTYSIEKSPETLAWFNRLCGWIRRRSERDNEGGRAYLLPDASLELKSGKAGLGY